MKHHFLSCFSWLPCLVPLLSFTLAVEAKAESQQYVGVLPLITQSPKQVSLEDTSYLTSVVRKMTGFLPAKSYMMMTNDKIDLLLQKSRKQNNQNLEDCVGECALKTARTLGAHWLITGKILKLESSLRVELTLIRSKDGNVLTASKTIKGTEARMLENPIKLASLDLMLHISQKLKDELVSKAGIDRNNQLKCLLNPRACKVSGDPVKGKKMLKIRSTSTPKMKVLQPSVSGGLSKPRVKRVVLRRKRAYQYCYDRQFQTNKNLTGQIKIKLVISAQGDVEDVVALQNTMNTHLVETCMLKHLKRLRFPKAENGKSTQVIYPFRF